MDKLFNDFGYGLFSWMVIILVILVVLLGKFAWKPIIAALETREEGIANALQAAENARKDMKNLQADNEKLLADARSEREAMMKEAREIREQMVNDAKADAQAQGDKMLAQAKQAIESEKNAAVAELKNQVATLSLGIAEKVLKEELSNQEAQSKLVEKLLSEAKLN